MSVPIVETRFRVSGIRSAREVRRAMQALFDVFAANGIGQAAFEISGSGPATLVLKHRADRPVDRNVVADALDRAGGHRLVED